MKETIKRLALLWTIGNLFGCLCLIGRGLARTGVVGIKVHGLHGSREERSKILWPSPGGTIIYYNHIGLSEALILPVLHYPLWLFSKWFLAISTIASYRPESRLLKPACVVVPKNKNTKEGSPKEMVRILKYMRSLVCKDRTLYIAPSGTRDLHHSAFFVLDDEDGVTEVKFGSPLPSHEYIAFVQKWHNLVVGKFQDGLAWLALNTKASFVPVWIHWEGLIIHITYGERFLLPTDMHKRQEATLYLAKKLLKLGKEAMHGNE